MGCTSSKSNEYVQPTKVVPLNALSPAEKSGSFKVRISESIKRRDPILFEKALQRHQPKVNDLIGNYDPKRSILHHLAQFNFAEGMSLIIDYILQKDYPKISQAINAIDSDGNTPAMVCCLHDAATTLEMLLKQETIDLNIKNSEGKMALEIALENSSNCVNLLSTVNNISYNKFSSKFNTSTTELPPTPRGRTGTLILRNSTKKISDIKEFYHPLSSILSMTKETPLGPTSKLFSIINDLKDKEANFVDEEFPHDLYSVTEEDCTGLFTENAPALSWLRPSDFMNAGDSRRVKLFEGIDLNDVATSSLAGCDLYSALGAMTEFPQRLINTFVLKEANKYGAYSVKFLISGIPVEIVLDDYFPCHHSSRLVYSKPLTNELWFLLLEKAFAKLYGSYSEIRNVSISEALEHITGMPSSQHSLKEAEDEEVWNSMLDYDKKNYIFCAGTYQKEDTKKNRIFTIISLHEHSEFKIIKLRNHFQDFNWDGTFSDKSKHWTKELKEELGYTKGEKTCIYMELKEFLACFDFLSVCHYNEGWFRNRVDVVTAPNRSAFFEISLEEETDLYIAVHQKLPRYVESPGYDISPVEILLAEKTGTKTYKKLAVGERDALIGKLTTYADENIKIRLPQGKYIIRTKVRWVDGREHGFTLSTFSSNNLILKQARIEDHSNFLEKVFIDAGSRIKEKYQFSNSCELISAWCGPHLWIYGINNGTKTWNLEIAFPTMTNIKLAKKYKKEDNTLKIIIPPGGQNAAYVKRVNSETIEVEWKLKHIWE